MISLNINGGEFWDPIHEYIIETKPTTLQLEHSLLSISKWEAKWKKPFLDKNNKTEEETLDYIRCMTISPNVDYYVYCLLTDDDIKRVTEYISDPMTATTINENGSANSREIITSELIYYWMISLNIPMECQKWHLNRLLTLIRVCSIKNQPEKKMSRSAAMEQQRALNAARRKALNTKG